MMTEEKPAKRRWTPYYKLPVVPLCPRHGVPCIVKCTVTPKVGAPFQKRYCTVAGCIYSIHTHLPAE